MWKGVGSEPLKGSTLLNKEEMTTPFINISDGGASSVGNFSNNHSDCFGSNSIITIFFKVRLNFVIFVGGTATCQE